MIWIYRTSCRSITQGRFDAYSERVGAVDTRILFPALHVPDASEALGAIWFLQL